MMDSFKKYALLSALIAFNSAGGADSFSFGIAGGNDTSGAVAFLISSSGAVTQITPLPGGGQISSVAINNSGSAIIGGFTTPAPVYAALISPSGTILSISPLPANGEIKSVAINNSGTGLIGGYDFSGMSPGYAAFVSTSGAATSLSSLPISGEIKSVAINDSGLGLIGGFHNSGAPYAAYVSTPSMVTPLGALSLPVSAIIHSVAINDSGAGIIGGEDDGVPILGYGAYAALVSPSGVVISLEPQLPTKSIIYSVAINNSGAAVIGGDDDNGATPAYAALVSPSGMVTSLAPMPTPNGVIHSVAINSSGTALIGGGFSAPPNPLPTAYAAFFSPTGVVTSISPLPAFGEINSVAISEFGDGILGGHYLPAGFPQPPFLALVSSTGVVTPLSLPASYVHGELLSVAFNTAISALSQIPTGGLAGNNLTFANYINENAPYDAFYFVPALFDGTLAQALESAAPTRNAISLFTADNNLFFLNSSFSRHSRDSRLFRRHTSTPGSPNLALGESWKDNLLASNSDMLAKVMKPEIQKVEVKKERPYELWGEIIGALVYQKAQHQTPAFQPTTGGLIFAFDAKATTHGRFGGGAAYAYTHIHEKQDAGHSHINQEYLFIYGLWDNSRFYFDGALWGGLFQSENVRKIHMTGFDFQSKSHPKGWQLSPHFEAGYDYTGSKTWLTLEPFVMMDWVNNWQRHFRERGSGPFNVGQKKHYSSFLRSELGLRFYETMSFNAWRLVLQEKVAYVNKKPFKVGTVNAFLIGAPGSFTVETLTTTQNLGVAEMQFIFEPVDPRYPYGAIAYQGEFCPMYQSHQASLNICWSF